MKLLNDDKTISRPGGYEGRKENTMNEKQIEFFFYAFEDILHIKQEMEETGWYKRIVRRLDNALGEIEGAVYLGRKGE